MNTEGALNCCSRWMERSERPEIADVSATNPGVFKPPTWRLDLRSPPAARGLACGKVPGAMTLGGILAVHPDAETGTLVARGVNGEERRRCPVVYVPSMRMAALVRNDCLMWYPATCMADALGLPGARPLPGLVELGALLPE